MKKLILFAALAALMIPFASATVPLGYVQLSGTYLQDSTGTMVANATISFAPVNASGVPISYQVNGHGQAIFSPVTALVTGGAFTVQLADTALTNPVNVCFAVTVTDNVSGKSVLGPGYNCVQPAGSGVAVTGPNAWCTAAGASGGTCNFDLYIPNEAALVVTQVGPTGPACTNGNTLWNGTSAPSSGLGLNGDFYLNTASSCLYGPKASGAWPTLCTMLATGPTGAAGTNGNTIWNGTSAPSSGLGANGDFYLNTVSSCLYGPKASGAWPTPCTSLIGPQGAAGPQGATSRPGSGGGGGSYTLPIAQPGTLGGVKPDGSSCTVNASTGVLSCVGSGGGGGTGVAVQVDKIGTYFFGKTPTKSHTHPFFLKMTINRPRGCTGADLILYSTIDSVSGPSNSINNDCTGTASAGFIVPAGKTFSVSIAHSGGGAAATVTGWLETSLPLGGGITLGTAGKIPVMNAGATAYAPVALSQDATITAAGAVTIAGLKGVPFCTGFTPTNGQAIEYPTGGTPNPCYAAVTPSGGGFTLPSQYKTWSCEPGLGDGLNVITAGAYLESTCWNSTGVTVTLTGVKCYTDTGTSTLNAAGNTLGALLTGAVTCTSSLAAGTQSANVLLTSGDYIKFTFVANGTAKQATWVATGTY